MHIVAVFKEVQATAWYRMNLKKSREQKGMATTSPAGVQSESSTFTTVISVLALVAIVALIYFIARNRATTPATQPAVQPPAQQEQPK